MVKLTLITFAVFLLACPPAQAFLLGKFLLTPIRAWRDIVNEIKLGLYLRKL